MINYVFFTLGLLELMVAFFLIFKNGSSFLTFGLVMTGLTLLGISIVAPKIAYNRKEQADWELYSVKNNCKHIQYAKSCDPAFNGARGELFEYTACGRGNDIWLCEDGVMWARPMNP